MKNKTTSQHVDTILASPLRPKRNGVKRSPTPKQKLFAREYAKTLNGTQSALKAYNTTNPKSASVMAVDTLAIPSVRKEIETLLRKNNIEVSEVFSIHRRNMLQDKHLPTSQKAVDSFHEMLGLKEQARAGNDVKIAFIIEK